MKTGTCISGEAAASAGNCGSLTPPIRSSAGAKQLRRMPATQTNYNGNKLVVSGDLQARGDDGERALSARLGQETAESCANLLRSDECRRSVRFDRVRETRRQRDARDVERLPDHFDGAAYFNWLRRRKLRFTAKVARAAWRTGTRRERSVNSTGVCFVVAANLRLATATAFCRALANFTMDRADVSVRAKQVHPLQRLHR